MESQCNQSAEAGQRAESSSNGESISGDLLMFSPLGGRQVLGRFDQRFISSDGGFALLREVDRKTRMTEQFAACFEDARDPNRVEFTLRQLVAQRVFGLALGYEDLNDHDALRFDPVLALALEQEDLEGAERKQARDAGKPLAGKSTLHRLETTLAGDGQSRYKKTRAKMKELELLFVRLFIQQQAVAPEEIVLDLDAFDIPLHGDQLGSYYHGYYDTYCYLPLYIFAGRHLLWAQLRPCRIDASLGSAAALRKVVGEIRKHWPHTRIIARGDSAFARDRIMRFCEDNKIDYVFGLARNNRLQAELEELLEDAEYVVRWSGQPCRFFKDFEYQTLGTWSTKRRVVGKAEVLPDGKAKVKRNPRYVVTSLSMEQVTAKSLYEACYCSRGEMENRIKEQQLGLFASRCSSHTMRTNQLRLYYSGLAYCLLDRLREVGYQQPTFQPSHWAKPACPEGPGLPAAGEPVTQEPAKAAEALPSCSSLRQRVLKVAVQLQASTRRVSLAFSRCFAHQSLFQRILTRLLAWTPPNQPLQA